MVGHKLWVPGTHHSVMWEMKATCKALDSAWV